MLEFLKHALGLCGESHPNLWTILLGTPVIGYLVYHVQEFKNKDK
jgi:hypothetical protein